MTIREINTGLLFAIMLLTSCSEEDFGIGRHHNNSSCVRLSVSVDELKDLDATRGSTIFKNKEFSGTNTPMYVRCVQEGMIHKYLKARRQEGQGVLGNADNSSSPQEISGSSESPLLWKGSEEATRGRRIDSIPDFYDSYGLISYKFNAPNNWASHGATTLPYVYDEQVRRAYDWITEEEWPGANKNLSFFAYAPYVKHTSAASGSVTDATYGITGFSRNSTAGDPIVKYIASFNSAETVDLCWGVVGSTETSWGKIQGAGTQAMTEGLPWLDVEHPQTVNQQLKFTFKHALAQLNVQIDADADAANHADGADPEADTKIYVRSISFTGIAMKGALNLNNPEANIARWLDYSGTTDLPYGESVTVKDGRRDGREGASGAEATNELPQGLNPVIVQNSSATAGVTHTAVNLFNGATLTTPVYVIPTGEQMTVTIVYDVETQSDDLTGYLSDGTTHGSSIENKITKTITWSSGTGLVSGKKYTLNLHLGMNSVNFDAAVADWDATAITGDAWLPAN